MKYFKLFLILIILATGIIFLFRNANQKEESTIPKSEIKTSATTVVADNLEIPWSLAFLPDGDLIFTERPGRVKMIDKEGNLLNVANISAVKHIGEGGLLGIAIDPDFINNNYVYLYYTYSGLGDNTLNRVARYVLKNSRLIDEKIIIDSIPGASNHNGGRIKFGADNLLYVTTGDAQNPSQAQDINSLAGKILRVSSEGKIEVYSYGHRNPQGLAWDDQGRLWATEHGRSGIQSGLDELNLIEAGKNYGWPEIQGDEKKEGMVSPVIHSGASVTWAPAGAAFYKGSIFFGGLRGESLFEYKISDESLKKHFEKEFGRIRDVVLGPDNFLYVTTSNKDGRGTVRSGDDIIIKIDLQKL